MTVFEKHMDWVSLNLDIEGAGLKNNGELLVEGKFKQFWTESVEPHSDLIVQAILAGQRAGCLASVFIAGYQSAIRETFSGSDFSGWSAFAVSEDRKGNPPLPGVDYHEDGSDLIVSGHKTWVAAVDAIDEIIVKAGRGDRAIFIKLPRNIVGLSFSSRPSKFLSEMSQGSAHLADVCVSAEDVLDDRYVSFFGKLETLYIYLAFLAFIGANTESLSLGEQSFSAAKELEDTLQGFSLKHDMDLDRIKRLDLEVQKIRESATDELGVLQKNWSTDSRLISMYSPGIQKSSG